MVVSMRVEFEAYDRQTNVVRVRTAVGVFSATWAGRGVPTPVGGAYIEFTTSPTSAAKVDRQLRRV
jgi:hypothetical protein